MYNIGSYHVGLLELGPIIISGRGRGKYFGRDVKYFMDPLIGKLKEIEQHLIGLIKSTCQLSPKQHYITINEIILC